MMAENEKNGKSIRWRVGAAQLIANNMLVVSGIFLVQGFGASSI